jgi:hypothetical protein
LFPPATPTRRPGSPPKPPKSWKEGQPPEAAGIRRRATRFGSSPSERTGADHAATYLTKKNPSLDYQTALAHGWPIATGSTEGACRHPVKDHMNITGARWALHGAQTVLILRALNSNGDFDAYLLALPT